MGGLLGWAVIALIVPFGQPYQSLGAGECVSNGVIPYRAPTSTVALCGALCTQFRCSAFEYWYASRLCGLFPAGTNVNKAAPATGTHAQCFAPATISPPPAASVINADFGYAATKGPCRGKVSETSLRSISSFGSDEALCKALCTADHECTGFRFVGSRSECQMHYLPLARSSMAANSPDVECQVKESFRDTFLSPGLHWERGLSAPEAMASSVMAALNGHLYVFGRTSVGTCVAYRYDIFAVEWFRLEAAPICDRGQALSGQNGHFFIVGGFTTVARGGSAGLIQTYDVTTGTWAQSAPAIPIAIGGAAVVSVDGNMFVFGGRNDGIVTGRCNVLMHGENSWNEVQEMPLPVYGAGHGSDGLRIYLFGGAKDGTGFYATPTDAVQVYSITAGTWSIQYRALPAPVFFLGAVFGQDGAFYLAGGSTGIGTSRHPRANADGTFNTVWRFDPQSYLVSPQPTLAEGVHSAAIVVDSSGTLYIAGGSPTQGRSCSDTLQIGHQLRDIDESLFLFITRRLNFDDAKEECESLGGQLAIIRDAYANQYVYMQAQLRGMTTFWIGGERNMSSTSSGDAGFQWTSPTLRPIRFGEGMFDRDRDGRNDLWFSGEPNNFMRRENCVRVGHESRPNESGWVDAECSQRNAVVCTFDVVTTTTTTTMEPTITSTTNTATSTTTETTPTTTTTEEPPTTTTEEPVTTTTIEPTTPEVIVPGWHRFSGTGCSYLQPTTEKMRWVYALELCEGALTYNGLNSSLAVLSSEDEAQFVATFETRPANPRWTGARRTAGRYFETVHGERFESDFWYPGEPQETQGHDCVAMGLSTKKKDTHPYKLNDAACSNLYIPLCQWCPGGFPTPSPSSVPPTSSPTVPPVTPAPSSRPTTREPTHAQTHAPRQAPTRIVTRAPTRAPSRTSTLPNVTTCGLNADPNYCVAFIGGCSTVSVRQVCPITCGVCSQQSSRSPSIAPTAHPVTNSPSSQPPCALLISGIQTAQNLVINDVYTVLPDMFGGRPTYNGTASSLKIYYLIQHSLWAISPSVGSVVINAYSTVTTTTPIGGGPLLQTYNGQTFIQENSATIQCA